MRRARERYQWEGNPEVRTQLMNIFSEKWRTYKKEIKEAKINDLRGLQDAADPMDPWGLAHKIMAGTRKTKATTWATVQDEAGR